MQFLFSFLIFSVYFDGVVSHFSAARGRKAARQIRPRDGNNTVDQNPCGAIIDEVNAGISYFPAISAFDCLTSVPFHAGVAYRFINYINTTIQFQSTLAYLKNPPKGYQQTPTDILGGLQTIKDNVTAGYYRSQYDFEVSLQALIQSAHDAHLSHTSGILSVFTFQAPFEISSVSPDGKSRPKIYLTDDIREKHINGGPSAVSAFNGQEPVEFLKELAARNAFGSVEAHADWNQLFTTPTLDMQDEFSLFYGHLTFYPGDELNVTMENGTTYESHWLASYDYPYKTGPLTTGASIDIDATTEFNKVYDYLSDEIEDEVQDPAINSPWMPFSPSAFPDPDISQADPEMTGEGVVSAYFLKDADTAVLSIPSFEQFGPAVGNFSETVSFFLGNASKRNLKRAVIDLQQNTGGTVELVLSTFKRFFPDLAPFLGSRRRSHRLADVLGESYTTRFNSLSKTGVSDFETVANEWVVSPRLNAATGKNFTTWNEYSNSTREKQDLFSATELYNLSSVVFDQALFDMWIPASDFIPGISWLTIKQLTDGACSSACSLLVEMFTQAGARTIAVGGQPTNGPMQAVGGNRGAAMYSSTELEEDIGFLSSKNTTVKALLPRLNDEDEIDSGVQTTSFSVNLRDQVRPNDTMPLQFRYVAADCRIFYSLDNVYNMSRLWRDAVAATFDDPMLCIEGSRGFKNDTKAAPAPPSINQAPLRLGEPDGGFVYTYDDDDGFQDAQDKKKSKPPNCGSETCGRTDKPCFSYVVGRI
ncbi:hypothetical protein CC80DRAFT_517619 [Byssothecium circinans]|uniref:CPAF-like PDZ domain-containing protein n=1 Tax=Byssothecium circinans TaxID=147558 RepID=A0A6A5TRY3_9PLEO|nr:hypothetical protein CC80DRAFT_517619 [Byssothecium circinans]